MQRPLDRNSLSSFLVVLIFSPSTSFCSKRWRNVGQYNWCRAGKQPFWKFSTVEESVKMIKSAFIIQPESNQDFMLNQYLSPFFFLLNCFHFIFFLKFGCFFPLAQLAIKTRYIIIYQVSSGQINPVIWVNFFFFFSWYEIIKCWCFWRQIEVIMIIMLRWPKQQKFGCNGQRARLVWTF